MKDYERIEVKKLPRDVVERLNSQAKVSGFKSRQAYLYEILTQLSLNELQLDAELRYKNLLEELKEVLKINTEELQKSRELIEDLVDTLE